MILSINCRLHDLCHNLVDLKHWRYTFHAIQDWETLVHETQVFASVLSLWATGKQQGIQSDMYISSPCGITVTSDPKGCGTAGKRIIFEFSSIFEFYHQLSSPSWLKRKEVCFASLAWLFNRRLQDFALRGPIRCKVTVSDILTLIRRSRNVIATCS